MDKKQKNISKLKAEHWAQKNKKKSWSVLCALGASKWAMNWVSWKSQNRKIHTHTPAGKNSSERTVRARVNKPLLNIDFLLCCFFVKPSHHLLEALTPFWSGFYRQSFKFWHIRIANKKKSSHTTWMNLNDASNVASKRTKIFEIWIMNTDRMNKFRTLVCALAKCTSMTIM